MGKKVEKNLELKECAADFAKLDIGDKVYLPTKTTVESWTFLGFNPVHQNYVLLESSYDVRDVQGVYIGKNGVTTVTYYTNYKRACEVLYDKAVENVDTVLRIFLKRNYVD